jgi:energy-coupling factor transporter ATP-binding protein EcfA2
MAYIDVFSALSSWLREKDDRCPATFILDGINPTIQGSSIWNLACATPIYNDVLLGGNSNAETYTNNIEADKVDKIDNVDKVDKVDTLDDKKKVEEDKQDEKEDDIVDCTEDNSSRDDSTSVSIKEEFQENSSSESSNASSNASSNTSANKPINNVIITGPNGSGKSTYIKSITECVILAQTLGLVPAREFKLTPFAHISTYLNIPDCQGKESLFQAEMNRCYQQLETLKSAEEAGEFTFNIMDEIFVSTNYQEGMSGAYAVINQLCRFNKCLNIITTHFDKLANLEDLRVVRKYFDIELGEDGQVARDFKIRDGVSKKHMALKLLRNRGFNEELVKDAENFYEKNCK